MPYSPQVGSTEDNVGPTSQIGVTSATTSAPTVITPDQSNTTADGAKTLKDAALIVVATVALLWGAVLGLKL